MRSGKKKPLVVLPTGAGKTVCFAWMAEASQKNNKTVWFLVHRSELLKQTEETFERFGIKMERIYIGMVGQVANNANKFPPPDVIIFDEGHHAAANTWKKITERYPQAWVIGLTATPSRLDGKPLGKIYDDLIVGISTADLIKQGHLSGFKMFTVQGADLRQLRTKRGEFDMQDASDQLMRRAVYGDVIDTYKEHAYGLQAICFCTTIAHSEAMADEFTRAGIDAVHFDGNTPKKQREEIVRRFKNNEIQILCNVDLIGEGFDMPACDCVIQLRPTQSLTIYLQQTGRALRPRDGKVAVILDHVGNLERHGWPQEERQWSLKDKVKKNDACLPNGMLKIRHCENCFGVYDARFNCCPICGTEYIPTRQEIENVKEVNLKQAMYEREQMEFEYLNSQKAINEARNINDFLRIAKARNYKAGWAYYQLKLRNKWTPY